MEQLLENIKCVKEITKTKAKNFYFMKVSV